MQQMNIVSHVQEHQSWLRAREEKNKPIRPEIWIVFSRQRGWTNYVLSYVRRVGTNEMSGVQCCITVTMNGVAADNKSSSCKNKSASYGVTLQSCGQEVTVSK